jgi:hypothetical protein
MPQVVIDGCSFAYSLGADGSYAFEVEGREYRFRQWTWGEKNRVTDAATTFEPDSGRLRIDIARFNELMLATCLVGSHTPSALRELNPVLGDTLLAIALWVNELAEADKKRLGPGTPGTAPASGPDDLSVVPGVRLDPRTGRQPALGRHREVRADPRRAGAPVNPGPSR